MDNMLADMSNLRPIIWLFGTALLVGVVGQFVVFRLLLRLTKRTKVTFDNALVNRCYKPFQWIVIILVVRIVSKRPPDVIPLIPGSVVQAMVLVLIALVAWLLIRMTYVMEDYVTGRFDIGARDNLKARKIYTQLRVLKRIVIIAVSILAFGTMLMTFESVRQLGKTILASAGVLGIVVGMAAQRTIAAFIAGIQIAITQPIRVDDVVIVENEWGRIEEITLTYVVVRIWDLRRLIVPITYFIEKPFQNWTRISADILGTVFIYTDYTVPIDAIREQLQKILNESEHWDKKVCVLQVTNATDRTMELRALMSAGDASEAWTLRCEVREKLLEFIKAEYPQTLPKVRAELNKLTYTSDSGESGGSRKRPARVSKATRTRRPKKG